VHLIRSVHQQFARTEAAVGVETVDQVEGQAQVPQMSDAGNSPLRSTCPAISVRATQKAS
jgi:hypothetical protein